MADYIGTNGFTYNIPRYVDPSSGPTSFKNFADTMPSFGVEIAAVSGTVLMAERHRGRILRWAQGGEYVVNDTLPIGAQVAVATFNAFVSVMTDSVQVEPASERLIPPYSMVTLTKVGAGMWLVAKGSGGTGSYFNEATGGTVTEIANYNGTGETWRVHTFTVNGTFDVSSDAQPFRVALVAGGQGGGTDMNRWGGTGGGSVFNDSIVLTSGSYPVVRGHAGAYGNGTGGNTTFAGLTAIERQGAGGGAPSPGPGDYGSGGGTGPSSNISGAVRYYGSGGGGGNGIGLGSQPGGADSGSVGFGGGGQGAAWSGAGGGGREGSVTIAYQIG